MKGKGRDLFQFDLTTCAHAACDTTPKQCNMSGGPPKGLQSLCNMFGGPLKSLQFTKVFQNNNVKVCRWSKKGRAPEWFAIIVKL